MPRPSATCAREGAHPDLAPGLGGGGGGGRLEGPCPSQALGERGFCGARPPPDPPPPLQRGHIPGQRPGLLGPLWALGWRPEARVGTLNGPLCQLTRGLCGRAHGPHTPAHRTPPAQPLAALPSSAPWSRAPSRAPSLAGTPATLAVAWLPSPFPGGLLSEPPSLGESWRGIGVCTRGPERQSEGAGGRAQLCRPPEGHLSLPCAPFCLRGPAAAVPPAWNPLLPATPRPLLSASEHAPGRGGLAGLSRRGAALPYPSAPAPPTLIFFFLPQSRYSSPMCFISFLLPLQSDLCGDRNCHV